MTPNHNISHQITCVLCGQIVEIKSSQRRNKFCSSSCAAKYNNSLRHHSNATKEKIRASLQKIPREVRECPICQQNFLAKDSKRKSQMFCSKSCASKHSWSINRESNVRRVTAWIRGRVIAGTHPGWQKRSGESYAEKIWRIELEKRGVSNFTQEYSVQRDDSALCYFIDFYFPESRIALEIDGRQHRFRKKHDSIRDEFLTSKGIRVIRFPWGGAGTKVCYAAVIKQVEDFLEQLYH